VVWYEVISPELVFFFWRADFPTFFACKEGGPQRSPAFLGFFVGRRGLCQ